MLLNVLFFYPTEPLELRGHHRDGALLMLDLLDQGGHVDRLFRRPSQSDGRGEQEGGEEGEDGGTDHRILQIVVSTRYAKTYKCITFLPFCQVCEVVFGYTKIHSNECILLFQLNHYFAIFAL